MEVFILNIKSDFSQRFESKISVRAGFSLDTMSDDKGLNVEGFVYK